MQTYMKKYEGCTELEKLKIFLQTVDMYQKLLEMDLDYNYLYSIIDEYFIRGIFESGNINNDNFNISDEQEKFGLNIEVDALIYACYRSNIDISNNRNMFKRLLKMKKRR